MTIEKLSSPLMYKCLNKKYKNPLDEQNFALGKVYLKKLCTNLFKCLYYISTCIVGYLILSQLDYFPTSLGGYGQMTKMFDPGFPNHYFHWKPEYFNIYYLGQLAYCITDLIWLLFIYEAQTDFLLMLLHHTCTISLISFSYLTNHSNIGCIVLFLHDLADIFVYIIRITINSNLKSIYSILLCVVLIIVYIYTRLYVFMELILNIWTGFNFEWHFVTKCLWGFLCFLYVMHINWIFLLFKRLYLALFKNTLGDTHDVKMAKKK